MLQTLFFHMTRLYGNFSPIRVGKRRIVFSILSFARINPWKQPENWRRVVAMYRPFILCTHGVRIRCGWEDENNLDLLLTSEYEPYETHVIEHLVCPGNICIDVGANIGYYTLIFARLSGPDGRVYSYEPVSTTNAALMDNVQLNVGRGLSEITVRKKALGDCVQTVPIYVRSSAISDDKDNLGLSSTVPDYFDSSGYTVREEQIEMTRLDFELIEGSVDFIKCDIEGAEKSFIEGGLDRLKQDQPMILMEWNPRRQFDEADLLHLFESLGDYVFHYVTSRGLQRMDFNEPNRLLNVLCSIRGKHDELLAPLVRHG